MKLTLNKETLQILLPEECEAVVGGTGTAAGSGFRCVRQALKGQPLGASSDLCCGSGSCPKPPQKLPAQPAMVFNMQPKPWTPPSGLVNKPAVPQHPQVKRG